MMEIIETLGQVLGNSHFEAWIAGPLVGAIAGATFTAIAIPAGPGKSGAELRPPLSPLMPLTQTGQVVHHHHYHGSQRRPNNGGDDPAPTLLIGLVVMMVTLVLFAAYLPTIAWDLYFGITSVSMFCFTVLICMLYSGRFLFRDWLNHAAVPLLISMMCFYLAMRARQNITDDVVVYAQGLLGDAPLSVQRLIPAAMAFFKAIGSNYALWMLLDMVAFVLICICTICAFGRCLNFVALTNLTKKESGIWHAIERWTRRFTGMAGTIFAGILLLLATVFSTGVVYQVIQQMHSK